MKDQLGPSAVSAIAKDIGRVWPAFEGARFVADCVEGIEERELLDRARHVADVLRRELPPHMPDALALLGESLGAPAPLVDGDVLGGGLAPLRHLAHSEFVARHGLEHFDAAMAFQRELARRFTAEFCVRPFLERETERTLAVLGEWVHDSDPHLRRLVSEGTRPRLPWGRRLRVFERDPAPVLALLEALRDDPTRYVQRSVANHLNDLTKDQPERVVELARAWLVDAPPSRVWIVRHALRTLVKRGHPGALGLVGAGSKPSVCVGAATFEPARVAIGDRLMIQVRIASASAAAQDLLVDYAVHFVKANGTRAPKVFKGRRIELAARAHVDLRFVRSFAPMTTRRLHPGRHAAALLVNGVEFPLGEFDLVE